MPRTEAGKPETAFTALRIEDAARLRDLVDDCVGRSKAILNLVETTMTSHPDDVAEAIRGAATLLALGEMLLDAQRAPRRVIPIAGDAH